MILSKFIRRKKAFGPSLHCVFAYKQGLDLFFESLSNELNNRNDVAVPNKVWGIDLTTLKQNIIRKPQYVVKLIIIVDFAAKNIIAHKLFLVKNHVALRLNTLQDC
jgi:hypothetical protein